MAARTGGRSVAAGGRARSVAGTGAANSLERAFALLALFERARRPMGVGEIVAELDVPRSSAAALVASMVRLGVLEHDRRARAYLPTLALAETGRWLFDAMLGARRRQLVEIAAALRAELGETVVVGVDAGGVARYVHVELPDRPMVYLNRVGAERPLVRSAIGWALIHDLPAAQVAALRQAYAAQAGASGQPAVDAAGLARELGNVHARGYAFSRQAYSAGIGMIAMRVPDDWVGRPVAIGVGGPIGRIEQGERRIVQALAKALGTGGRAGSAVGAGFGPAGSRVGRGAVPRRAARSAR